LREAQRRAGGTVEVSHPRASLTMARRFGVVEAGGQGSRRFPDAATNVLIVKLQEVVPGQTESADGCLFAEASMRSMPVVAMQPKWKIALSLI
jgi:hypothetical protein